MNSTHDRENARTNLRAVTARARGVTVASALVYVFAALACHTSGVYEATGSPLRDADITHVSLDLACDWERQRIAGSATLWLRALRPETRAVRLAADGLTVREVLDGAGRTLPWESAGGTLTVALAEPLPWPVPQGVDEPLRIVYAAAAGPGLTFGGAAGPAAFSPEVLAQPGVPGAWAPLPHWRGERATADARIRADHDMLAVAAGAWLGVEDHGAGERTATWRLAAPAPLGTLAFAAARFTAAEDPGGAERAVAYTQRGAAPVRDSGGRAPALLAALRARLGPGLALGPHAEVFLQRSDRDRAVVAYASGAWFGPRAAGQGDARTAAAEAVARRWLGVTLAPLDPAGAALAEELVPFLAAAALADAGLAAADGAARGVSSATVAALCGALGEDGLWRALRRLCDAATERPEEVWFTAEALREAALQTTGHDVGALLRRFRP